MTELSKRHHYIPRFLIKNFGNSENKLWVYNKMEKRFLKTPQSPKAIFFEMNRNTFDINGNPGDNIEKIYADVDDLLAKTLDKILSTHVMTGKEQSLMIFLVSLMKWRIPKADILFGKLSMDIPIEDLGIAFRPVDPSMNADVESINKIYDLDVVKELKRLLLSVQPLLRQDNFDETHKSCFIMTHDQIPALLGDCPLIETPNTGFENLENFIFPLSSTDTLICKKGSQQFITSPIFFFQKDLAIFHLSEKYVACKSRDHLKKIINTYYVLENEGKAHLTTGLIFEYIV